MMNMLLKKINYLKSLVRIELCNIKVTIYKCLFRFAKVQKDKIVLVNESYNCNPKAIAEEILRRKLNYRLFWLSDYEIKDIPAQIVLCRKTGIKGAYHLATSKIIIINSKGDFIRYYKKKEQYLIQTFHGSLTMKYVEAECENKLPPFYVKNSKKDSAITDLALSNSEWMTNQLHNAIWYNGEVFESGFPRNDIFFGISEERKKQIRDSIGINLGIKVVTYAPTFRDNGDVSCYELDPNAIIKALEEKTHEKWILLVRAHPNLSGNLLPFDFNDRIINVSFYPDGQEILLISDVLISDYSSIMMDFFLMKRPILLYVKDELQYKELRGLRPEYYQVPFPHCKDNDELVKSIKEIDMDSPYGDEFSKIYGVKDDGHASERVVDRIVYEMSN